MNAGGVPLWLMEVAIAKILFKIGLCTVFYAYLGYGLVLWLLTRLSPRNKPVAGYQAGEWPEVTFVVCAYNEADWMGEKIANSLALDYPRERILFCFVTDGSDDATPDIVRQYPFPADVRWQLLHQPERRGKIAAFQRAMQAVKTPVVVSTDANTSLNPEAVRLLARHFSDPAVGAVAGEKRIAMPEKSSAGSAGEGIYWQYESLLKKWDSRVGSVIGAAGELFALRTEAYEDIPTDTLVEDFYLTMCIAQKGWRVCYEPDACAVESASASVGEELKRKVRIAAGGLQAVVRLAPLLNIFRYGMLSFQYISHRVLRWTLAPLFLPVIFFSNLFLAFQGLAGYRWLFALQLLFYGAALLGWLFEKRRVRIRVFFVPYYFCVMNWAMYAGFVRLLRGKQSVIWEKAARAQPPQANT